VDAFSFLRRRTFLKLGILGIAGVGAAGGGLAALRGDAPAVAGLGVLDAHRYRTLLAIAAAQIPAGGVFAPGAGEPVARLFDGFLQGEPAENVADLRTALLLVEYGPVIFERRLTTFSNLPVDEQLRHWRSWAESELLVRRQVALAFRKFIHLVVFDDPTVWPHIGYPGPSLWGAPTAAP
jgi:hypothetical protein